MPENPKIELTLFDSMRQPIRPGFETLVRIINGNHKEVHSRFHQGQPPLFEVEFFNNFSDDYTVIVSAKKHHDAGFFPVKVAQGEAHHLDLMLLPKKSRYDFTRAAWDKLKRANPALIAILASGLPSEVAARGLYDKLLDGPDRQQDILATIHNVTTALKAIRLPVGQPLNYFKQLIWDQHPPRRDRFFAYAEQKLVAQIRQARLQGNWESSPAFPHPGATSSFKQVQFGEANVQLSFHEKPQDLRVIDGVTCVKVEADLDYFKDKAAHLLLEVIPNAITGNQTDPKIAYLLRWMAGKHSNVTEFDPPYTIEAVT
jgi:hypothetical protein